MYNGSSWVDTNEFLISLMEDIKDENFAFSVHQYFDEDYSGKNTGSGGANQLMWDAMDELTTSLGERNFLAYLTETNILKESVDPIEYKNEAERDNDDDYQVMKKLVEKMGERPDVWKGLCAWQSTFIYGESGNPSTGNIYNGPQYGSDGWKEGPRSTAPWFTTYLPEDRMA